MKHLAPAGILFKHLWHWKLHSQTQLKCEKMKNTTTARWKTKRTKNQKILFRVAIISKTMQKHKISCTGAMFFFLFCCLCQMSESSWNLIKSASGAENPSKFVWYKMRTNKTVALCPIHPHIRTITYLYTQIIIGQTLTVRLL